MHSNTNHTRPHTRALHYFTGQQELWIFGVMMLWEYYSMIYVRSTGSIQLFPRASLALFLVYHFYYFSFPSGFHVLALVTMFFFLLALMVSVVVCVAYGFGWCQVGVWVI